MLRKSWQIEARLIFVVSKLVVVIKLALEVAISVVGCSHPREYQIIST